MEGLNLYHLPDLPQRQTLREMAMALWQHKEVIALWLGGSLAHRMGDILSDIDLHLAVVPSHLAYWEEPLFERIFGHLSVVGQAFLRLSDDSFFHHLILSNGELCDLCVQSTVAEVTQEPRLILGCRSDLLASQLLQNQSTLLTEGSSLPDGETFRHLLGDFWINTHKHRKFLFRSLELLCIRRIQLERDLLLRLWYIHSSGNDYGMARHTAHSLAAIVRTVRAAVPQALHILGTPTRNHQEIIQAIELNRSVIAELGRRLAQSYGFEYPSALEATVLRSWQDFREWPSAVGKKEADG